MVRSSRIFMMVTLITLVTYITGCSQVIYEGVRKGELISSKTTCKHCEISREAKIEATHSKLPDKVRVYHAVTYGDKVANKYESIGYKRVGRPSIIMTGLVWTSCVVLSAGILLLWPDFYKQTAISCTHPKEKNWCSFTDETWKNDNFEHALVVNNEIIDYEGFSGPANVAILKINQSPDNELQQAAKPAKKTKKTKKDSVRKANQDSISSTTTEIVNKTVYASDGYAQINLCDHVDSLVEPEYRIRFSFEGKALEERLLSAEVFRQCHDALTLKADRMLDEIEMPEPPK